MSTTTNKTPFKVYRIPSQTWVTPPAPGGTIFTQSFICPQPTSIITSGLGVALEATVSYSANPIAIEPTILPTPGMVTLSCEYTFYAPQTVITTSPS